MPYVPIHKELLEQLPLPLAQLYLGAVNAIEPSSQHVASYYLWEACIKLTGAVAIAEFAAATDSEDPSISRALRDLARPTFGQWRGFLRQLVPVLGATDDSFSAMQRILSETKPKDSLPRLAHMFDHLATVLEGDDGIRGRSLISINDVFEVLVRYRNKEIAHGAYMSRTRRHHEELGQELIFGVVELLWRLEFNPLAARQMTYVSDVRQLRSGGWLIERLSLTGPFPRRLASVELMAPLPDSLPRAGQVYLQRPISNAADRDASDHSLNRALTLEPFVRFDSETNEVFFFNGRQGRQNGEFLCLKTGRQMTREPLASAPARVLGWIVDGSPGEVANAHQPPKSASAPEEPDDDESPERSGWINGFQLRSKIGEGGWGEVYRAWQPSLCRQVALKLLKKIGDPKADERFEREIHALGKIEHPNLVGIFESGAQGGSYFFAMELIEGTDLGRVCKKLSASDPSTVTGASWRNALTAACQEARDDEVQLPAVERDVGDFTSLESEATDANAGSQSDFVRAAVPHSYVHRVADIMLQVAEASEALHKHHVIHRDIKPSNILLSADESRAVLTDLGAAQLVGETQGRHALTTDRDFVGTYRYASPEQISDAHSIDETTDIYSLGATFWELLTLRQFRQDISLTSLARQASDGEPAIPPRQINGRVDPDLNAIVLKCLEPHRRDRYQTAQDLVEDLRRRQQGELVHAHPSTLRYLLRKTVIKYRRPILVLGSVTAVLVLTLILLAAQFFIADQALRQARFAVAQLRETEKKLEFVPGAERLRKDIALQQREFHQEMLKNPIFPLIRPEERGQAHYRLGLAEQQLGSYVAALDDYDDAREIQERALGIQEGALKPDDMGLLRDLGNTWNSIGWVQDERAEHEAEQETDSTQRLYAKASKAYTNAKKYRAQVCNTAEKTPDDQRRLANTLMNLAQIEFKREDGDLEAAGKALDEVQKLRDELLDDNSLAREDRELVRRDLGKGYFNLGMLHFNAGELHVKRKNFAVADSEFAHADTKFSNAANLFQELVEQRDQEEYRGEYQQLLADSRRMLGDTKTQLNPSQIAAAISAYREAILLYDNLLRRHPEKMEYRFDLARVFMNLATLQWQGLGKPDVTLYSFERARDLLEKLNEESDGEPPPAYRKHLDLTIAELGNVRNSVASEDLAAFAKRLQELGADQSLIGVTDDALLHFRFAVRYWRYLLTTSPGERHYLFELAATRRHLVAVQYQAGLNEAAQADFETFVQDVGRLDDEALSTYADAQGATALKDLITQQVNAGDVERARQSLQLSIRFWHALAEKHRDQPKYRSEEAAAVQMLGFEEMNLGQVDEGKTNLRKSIDIYQTLAVKSPEEYRQLVLDHLQQLTSHFENLGTPYDELREYVDNALNSLQGNSAE